MSADLCRPIDPFTKQPPVYVKNYPVENYTLSIRPLCIPADIEILYNCLEEQAGISSWKIDSPRKDLHQTYQDILESDFAQSLLCLLDDRPVCQIDITRAPYNEVFMYLDAEKGDYAMWIIMFPDVNLQNSYVNIVKTVMEYLFSLEEIQRVITYLPSSDEWSSYLLMNAGFEYLDTLQMLTVVVNIYEYKRMKKKK